MRRIALFLLVAVLLGAAAGRDAFDRWVAATDLPVLIPQTSTEVLDRNGTLLRAYTVADGRWRMAVSLDAVDPDFLAMLIAYEDKRFYSHAGVDPLALARAGGQALWHGRVVSGGSTLTMQVARLLEESGTGRWAGKLRQMRVALALERQLTKQEILTLYLHHAPYGGNIEGLRAATRAWFGKDPGRLTPAQAALLVALPQAPEARRPDRYPAAARQARDMVLSRLLPDDLAAAAKTEPIPGKKHGFPAIAPHLSDRARSAAPARPVHQLTIDAQAQTQLEALAKTAIRGRGNKLSVAIMVADHQSGEILASVGSAGYEAGGRLGFVDMTRALRSPGSTLKPLIYGMAFDEGLAHPETLIDDTPTAFGTYAPQNFDGEYRGTIRVREALQQSLNIPVVKLTEALGPAKLLERLRRTGAAPALPGGKPGLAVALGGLGLTLEDLTTLYASLANGGRVQSLSWKTGSNTGQNSPILISPEAAWQVADILSGLAPPPNAPRGKLAYKTGTSYGHRDAWALGFDGRHVVGVWMGRADGTAVPGAFGGDLAAPLLFEAFGRIKPEFDPLPPPPPATLIVPTARLPQPLRHFRPREAVFAAAPDAPSVAFPPDGAVMSPAHGVTVKVRDGIAPFTWFANGRPLAIATHERETQLDLSGPGFVMLSVVDAQGRSARAHITLE